MDQGIDSVISHARNAPIEPVMRIARDNVLDTIDRAFYSNNVIFLEGDPLSGKSEIAAQYMRRHEGLAVAAFLTATAPMFYSAAFLRLTLAEQINQLVFGPDAPQIVDLQLSEAVFNQYILRLQRIGRRNPITFVIDGLSDSEKVDRQNTLEIFNQLPAVQSEFRFLITGSERLFRELSLAKKDTLKIPGFSLSLPETTDYLSDLGLDTVDIRALHTYSSGNIGLLHKLRTLIVQGASLDDLLTQKKGTLSEVFEYEWDSLKLNSLCQLALAFIAFSHFPLSTEALSDLTESDVTELEELLGRCRLIVRHVSDDTWSIRSDAQRRFVGEKLEDLRKEVEGQLIARLIGLKDNPDASRALPSQLIAAGQHTEALKRLTGDHFLNLLSHENSLRPLKTHAEYGVISAKKNDDIHSELRFSLIQSTINGTTLDASSTHEIEALLALGMEDAAAALALSATIAEERLRQLAATAGCFGRMGKEPPEQVLVALRELLTELEAELPEPALITIAAELFSVDIDLSLQLLERAADASHRKHGVANSGGRDSSTSTVGASEQDSGESVVGRELSSKLRPVLDAAAHIVKAMSAEEVLRRIQNLEESHKLFLLQRWLEAHRRSLDAPKVAFVALDIVLRDTSRSPKIRDIREIAIVAPHIADREVSTRLTARLEAQSNQLIGHGTSEEAVRLRMSLLRAKHKWNPNEIDDALIDLFVEVHEVSDVGIRTACYAWMLYHLGHLHERTLIEERTGIIAETTKHLLASIDILHSQTADHYLAAVDAIRALCMCDPERAVELVSKINTEERRNKGYRLILRCIAVNKTYNDNVEVLISCIERMTNKENQEKNILYLLYRMSAHLATANDVPIDPRLLLLWKRVLHPSRRVQALILTFKITRQCVYLLNQDGLLESAKEIWGEVQRSWLKVDVGYWAVSQLAAVDKIIAEQWLDMVRKEVQLTNAPSHMAGSQLYFVADLAGRVFAHYVASQPQEFDNALARLSQIVALLPGLDEQAHIWTQIGVSLWYKSKRDLSAKIVETKIEPLLAQDFERNQPLEEDIVFETAPLLYLSSAAAANARLNRTLPPGRRDEARDYICGTIMRKMLPAEFYQERERSEFDLTYSEASDVLSQIGLMSTDSAIYKNVARLCNSLTARRNRGTIRRNQVADLLVDLKNTVSSKLPDQNNIKHQGFLVACLAEILRCQLSETRQKDNGQWLILLRQAESIPNRADRAIVISMVASCANGSGPFSDGKWFEGVRKDILNIPSDRDRLERFQWVAEILEPFDKVKCRNLVKEAMLASTHLSSGSAIDKRQKILDLAHSIDPGFVDEVVNLLDDDEATKIQKKLLRDHSKLLDARKEAATDINRLNLKDYSLDDLIQIAVRNLRALNAGRQIPQNTRDFMQLAEASKHYPFPLTFPLWLWIFESSLRKATQQSAQKVLPLMYECICSVADVAVSLLARSGGSIRTSLFVDNDTIKPGCRDQLFLRIHEWVIKQEDSVIYISDPYFGPEDLDVVKAIAEAAGDKEIVILTSKEHVNKKSRGLPPEEVFRASWDQLCDGAPPVTEIVVIGFGPEGKHPIHDRWIISGNSGLRLGTSPNSIGLARISEISEMDSKHTAEKAEVIDLVLRRSTRDWEGYKLYKAKFLL